MALLHRPEPKQLLEIAGLMKHHHSQGLIEILKAELVTTQSLLVDTDEQNVHRLQGRGRLLKDLLQLLQDQAKKDSPL